MTMRHLSCSAALATFMLPALLFAGDYSLSESPLPGSDQTAGWHLGLDPMAFASGANSRDLLVGGASYMNLFDADFDSLPGEVSAQDGSIVTPILPLSNGRLRVLTYLSYRATAFETSTPNLLTEDTLHSIRLPVAMIYDYSDDWIFGAVIMPGLSGDLGSTGDAFSFSALAGFGYKSSPHLRWFGGLFYSTGFGDDLLIPGIGVMWTPSPNWSVNILPPLASINWRFRENYFLSLFARYDPAAWNVEADSAGPDRDIEMTSTRVGLRLERRLSDHVWAQVSAGMSIAREMEIETLNNKSLQKDDIDSAPFAQLGLSIRY